MRFTLTLSLLLVATASTARAADVDFNRDVRPILASRCFKCHGPDETARKAKLRLDTSDGALRVLGKPAESELVRRILSADESGVMPPAALKTPLSAKQKETLKTWVANGAKYESHWSFVPPKRPPVPAVPNGKALIRNPIDAFIVDRLAREGLSPSPPADRYTLGAASTSTSSAGNRRRRKSMRFCATNRPPPTRRWWIGCWRRRNTASAGPDAGSTWPATPTPTGMRRTGNAPSGLTATGSSRAFNDDMPFDRFTVEQLAGDMLPNATLSQRIATGFHRNTMLNEEGGIDPLEFRYYAVVDRTNATATVWLGLTVGCAQCHTHKFDPITHTEYYRLLSCLNNADEPELACRLPR